MTNIIIIIDILIMSLDIVIVLDMVEDKVRYSNRKKVYPIGICIMEIVLFALFKYVEGTMDNFTSNQMQNIAIAILIGLLILAVILLKIQNNIRR